MSFTESLATYINTKLNENSLGRKFKDGFLIASEGKRFIIETVDESTLEIDVEQYTPYMILAFENENQALADLNLGNYSIPLTFGVYQKYKSDIMTAIQELQDLLTGISDVIDGRQVSFNVTDSTPISGIKKFSGKKFVNVTLTIFATAGKAVMGNSVSYYLKAGAISADLADYELLIPAIKGTVKAKTIQVSQLEDENISKQRASMATRITKLVIYYSIDNTFYDLIAKEIEDDTDNSAQYHLKIVYPSFTISRDVFISAGSITTTNGTPVSIELELKDRA